MEYLSCSSVSSQPIMCSRTLWPICSANTLLPVHSWLQYDSKFRILAAADPLLCWNRRHPDLWLKCLASEQKNKRWPCPYCRSTNHFLSNCPHAPFASKNNFHQSTKHQITKHQITKHQITDLEHQIAAEHIPIQSVVCLIKDTAPVKTSPINTFAFPAKVSTPRPSAQEGEELPPVSANSKAPIQPLILECETSLPQQVPHCRLA